MALDTGDTAFLLVCTAMVMLMTPGVGLFYGGLVRRKNLISMLALSFIAFSVVTIQWVTFGYSPAFGPDVGGLIGGLDYVWLSGVGAWTGMASLICSSWSSSWSSWRSPWSSQRWWIA